MLHWHVQSVELVLLMPSRQVSKYPVVRRLATPKLLVSPLPSKIYGGAAMD